MTEAHAPMLSTADLALPYDQLRQRCKDVGKGVLEWRDRLTKSEDRPPAQHELTSAIPNLAKRFEECFISLTTREPWNDDEFIINSCTRLLEFYARQEEVPILDVSPIFAQYTDHRATLSVELHCQFINLLGEFLHFRDILELRGGGDIQVKTYDTLWEVVTKTEWPERSRNTALQVLVVYITALSPDQQTDLIAHCKQIDEPGFPDPANRRLLEELSRYAKINEHLFRGIGALGDRPSSELPLIITILSRKGGVGKTTMAVTLALALAEKGKSTYLLDLDFTGLSLPFIFRVPASADVMSIDQFFGGEEYDKEGLSELLPKLFQEPKSEYLRSSGWSKNLKLAQPTALPYIRHGMQTRAISPSGYSKLLARFNALLKALSTEDVKVVIIDNSPGLQMWPLLSLVVCLRSGGIPVIMTSADVQDIGGLQVEWDLVNTIAAKYPSSHGAHWYINKVPTDLREKYATAERLTYELRSQPAVEHVPLLLPDRAVAHYLFLKDPRLISLDPLFERVFALDEHGVQADLEAILRSAFKEDALDLASGKGGEESLLACIVRIVEEKDTGAE